MAAMWYRSKVRLHHLMTRLFRNHSSRVVCITVVLVVTVFALNLDHLETCSGRQRHGRVLPHKFFLHEEDTKLPVMQRGVLASYDGRGPLELLGYENKMAQDVSSGVIKRQEVRRVLLRGDAQGNIELGTRHLSKDGSHIDGGDTIDEVKRENRTHGVFFSDDTKRKTPMVTVRTNGTKRIETKHENTFNRRGKVRRDHEAFKEIRGGDQDNGDIRNMKTFSDILERRRHTDEKIKKSDKLLKNDTKSNVLPLNEMPLEDSKHLSNINNTKVSVNCARLITIYASSTRPFGAWPEYGDLRRLFDDGKRYSGNIASSPTGYVVCPDQPCDINLIPTNDDAILAASDAVLLNVAPFLARPHVGNISERLIKTLPKRVKIVLYGMESANMMNYWDKSIRDIQFHYSMTYHSSSDLVHPYGRYIPGEPMDDPGQPLTYTEGKTKILAWMASNCNYTFWPRYEWVSRLQEHIHIDTYGRCGHVSCLPRFSEKCVRVMRSYKFYLALENTQCDEYITEKFWDNSLLNGVVPVVYGGRRESYEKIAPPGSFIYAGDFASPKELADYLVMLDKDDSQYSEFFAWRKLGRVEKIYPNLKPTSFCDLLPLLSSGDRERVRTIKRAGDTEYFLGCREDKNSRFIERGDINNWSPWK